MDPRKFLEVAKSIEPKISAGPAENRRAISGAYYAAFNVAVEFLKQKAGLQPNKTDKHRAVKLSLIECKNDNAKQLGMKLDSLHTERKKADYEMENAHPERQQAVKAACNLSQEIITGLDGFVLTEVTSVVSGMRSWAANHANELRTL